MIAITDVPAKEGGFSRWVELKRPTKLNCLSLRMLEELLAAVEGHRASSLVLTGAGTSFCTGLDLKEVAGPIGPGEHLRKLLRIYGRFLRAEIPTVVLARGYAAGGGAGLVACARTAIVASDFRFLLPGGELSKLAAVVVPLCGLRAGVPPPGRSGWLGTEFTAAEAKRLGLVDQVVSAERLSDLIEKGQRGVLEPDLLSGRNRTAARVERALQDIEEILTDLSAR